MQCDTGSNFGISLPYAAHQSSSIEKFMSLHPPHIGWLATVVVYTLLPIFLLPNFFPFHCSNIGGLSGIGSAAHKANFNLCSTNDNDSRESIKSEGKKREKFPSNHILLSLIIPWSDSIFVWRPILHMPNSIWLICDFKHDFQPFLPTSLTLNTFIFVDTHNRITASTQTEPYI